VSSRCADLDSVDLSVGISRVALSVRIELSEAGLVLRGLELALREGVSHRVLGSTSLLSLLVSLVISLPRPMGALPGSWP